MNIHMAADNLADEIEYYDSSDQLLQEDDIIETDVHILGWKRKFRIRALTFGQMERINKNSLDDEGNLLHDKFVYHTIVEGVIRPRFKIDQAIRLSESNGSFVQELSDEIWKLGRLSKTLWDEFITEAKRKIKLEKGDFNGESKPKD